MISMKISHRLLKMFLIIGLAFSSSAIMAADSLPAVKLQKLTRGSLNTSSLKGRYTVIQFWASWCVGCSDVMVAMDDIVSNKSKTRFVTVSLDENMSAARSYFNDKPKNVKALRSKAYLDAGAKLAEAIAVESLPAVVVVAPNGKIIQRFSGHPSQAKKQQIDRLLK